MEITKLRCSACNGPLKIEENNPCLATCEYCKTAYYLEENEWKKVSPDHHNNSWYTPREPVKQSIPKTGWEYYGWKRITLATCTAIFLIVAAKLFLFPKNPVPSTPPSKETIAISESQTEQPIVSITGIFASMVESAYEKPVDSIIQEELDRFQWIEISFKSERISIGYSFDNPYEIEDASLTWLDFSRDQIEVPYKAISRFKGLKKISIPSYLSSKELDGLNLKGIGCYSNSPEDLAASIEHPEQIKELVFLNGVTSLEGLDLFQNLESLTFSGKELTDIKELINLKNLTSLTLKSCDEITDFSVLSLMPSLQNLYVDSKSLADISFISQMHALESLALIDTRLLKLDALEGNTTLTSLTVENCSELIDLSVISHLSRLTELSLEVPYDCPDPDLSELISLRHLTLSGFKSIHFLNKLTELQTLSLFSCTIDEPSAFSMLQNLKEFSCHHISGEISKFSFVCQIPALETLTLNGLTTYEDLSNVFNLESLKTLSLNGVECEIDFSNLRPNESLTCLRMDGVKLYTNVIVSGELFVSVDYDMVFLDEQTDFLVNYPNLSILSLADNKLTQISFASSLQKLKELDIKDNYITDLEPLADLTDLQLVNCKGNPIGNEHILRDDVTILK